MRAFTSVKRIFVFLYVMAITALLLLPRLKYSFTLVQIVVFSAPFILIALIDGKTVRKVFAINIILLFITFMSTWVFNFGGSISNTMNLVVPLYLYMLPLLICQYLIDLNDKTLMKWITVATCCILLYIMFVTFREFSVDPKIARRLAYGTNDDEYINSARKRNIGGFGFCYCIGMFAPYLTSIIARVKGKEKVASLLCLIVLLVFSIYTQYTTLIFLSVISIFYVVLTQGKMSLKKIIALLLLAVIAVSFKSIMWYLANNIGLSTLSHHFMYIYNILGGEEDFNRWSMYKANIAMFLRNPIFGADLTNSYNNYLFTAVHSQIFGRLSGGGIVGFSTYAGFVASAWYYLVKKSGMRYLIPVFLVYIALAFLNPIQPEIAIAVFMVIPLIEYQFINKEEQYYV